MLGGKGKALVILIGGFIDEIRSMMGSLLMDFAGFNQKILEIRKSLGLVSDENFVKILNQNNQLVGIATNLKKPINEYRKELEATSGGLDTTTKKLRAFLETLEAKALLSAKQVEEILNKLKGATEESKKVGLELGKVKENILTAFKKDFESINETLGKMAQSGIKAFSRGLAEALVLGKNLNMTFKEIAQKLLVDIVAFTIQLVIQETIRNALKKEEVDKEREKTKEMQKQLRIQGMMMLMGGNPMGFLGFTSPGFAKGGAVSKGQPVVVGERGAELFIPNSSGQITQSARGTGGGAVNVNFTINTIDSRGFDQALLENRGTISSIINSALSEKGRGELI
jgi:hypothetical protein